MQNSSTPSRLPVRPATAHPITQRPSTARPATESSVTGEGRKSRRREARHGGQSQRRIRRRLSDAPEHPALVDANGMAPLQNRISHIAQHATWFGFRTQARLARDSGVSRAAVSRLIRHQVQPSLFVALRVTRALSVRLGRPLDVWEVFSLDGTYPTASVCELCGCRSCSLGADALAKAEKRNRKGGA